MTTNKFDRHGNCVEGTPGAWETIPDVDKMKVYAQALPVHDAVNHPSHYCSHPSGVECVTIAEHFNFNLGNALKYLWRAGLKGELLQQDLQKAAWYINRELQRIRESNYKGSY